MDGKRYILPKNYIISETIQIKCRRKKALQTICCFIVKCYTESLFTAPDAVQAPLIDLIFIKKLHSYKNDDKLLQK